MTHSPEFYLKTSFFKTNFNTLVWFLLQKMVLVMGQQVNCAAKI